MKTLLILAGLLLVANLAYAGPGGAEGEVYPNREACNLPVVTYDWDFAVSDQGFTTLNCEAGGAAVWEWGSTTYVPGAPGTVWGTVLEGDYPSDAGDGLVSPAFLVGDDSNLMEIGHYVDIETNYDGGNASVGGTVIPPTLGYPAVLSTSTSFYAWCVDMEEGFTGHEAAWVEECFDLSGFAGETIQVEFDFGSDSSVTYPGWYLAYVRVGGEEVTPTIESSWGQIKGLYR